MRTNFIEILWVGACTVIIIYHLDGAETEEVFANGGKQNIGKGAKVDIYEVESLVAKL